MKDETGSLRINPYELLIQNPNSTFFLQADGDMPELGIAAGDYIVADRQAEASDGKLVIASLNDELPMMKLRRDGGAVLEANSKFLDITGKEHVFILSVISAILWEI